MKSTVWIITLLVMLGCATSAQAASTEGFGSGFVQRLYPGVNNATPLLNTFYFRFDKRLSGPVDRHINSIVALPAGPAKDLSPNAQIPAPRVSPGRIGLIFKDKSVSRTNDRYFYKMGHETRDLGPIERLRLRDVGCRGQCVRTLPPRPSSQHVFVLIGFQFYFTGGRDHHIDQVAMFERGGKLTVRFNDKNNDDVFGYLVDYAWVPRQLLQLQPALSGTAKGGQRKFVSRGSKVIRGFGFNYRSKDHEVREIGVLTFNDRIEVFYADHNADDTFNWHVDWAIVNPPSTVSKGMAQN